MIFLDKNSVIEVLKDKKEKGVYFIDVKEVEVKWVIFKDDDSFIVCFKMKKIFIGGLKDEVIVEDIY